jgi:Tfp pilus assembly protein PilF
MKRLNIRLLVVLALGVLVVSVGTHFLHGYQLSRMADSFLARADEAKAQGDDAEEIKLLQRYMLYRPKDVPTLKRLLNTIKNKVFAGGIEGASFEDLNLLFEGLNRAVQSYPEDIDLRREAIDFALRVQRIPDAKDNLAALESLTTLNSDDKVKWAQCLIFENDNDKAIQLLGELIGFDRRAETIDPKKAAAPNELRAYSILADLYRVRIRQNDFTIPDLIMDHMVQANADQFEAYLTRADYYRLTRKGREGIEMGQPDLQKAVELAPDDARVIIAAADSKMRLSQFEEARELLNKGLEKYPDDSRMYHVASRLSEMMGDQEAALQHIVQGLERLKQNRGLMVRRAELELDLGKSADARTTYERIKDRVTPLYAEYLLARLEMTDGKYLPASERLERVRTALKTEASIPGLIDALRFCYDKLGKRDLSSKLDRANADSPDAKLRLAQDLKRRGSYKEALALFQELSELKELTEDGKKVILYNLYDVHIDLQNALPENDRNWDHVEQLGKKVIAALGLQGADLEFFEIDSLLRKGRLADARLRVERAVISYPRDIKFWLQLDRLTRDHEQGLKILERMKANVGDTPEGRLAVANRLVQANPPDLVERLEALRHGLNGFNQQGQQQVMNGLASQFERIKEYSHALAIWKDLQAQSPDSAVIANKIFETALASGDEKLIDESMGRLSELTTKNSTEFRIAEIKRHLWEIRNDKRGKEELGDLISRLDKLSTERPDWYEVYQLKGDAFVQQSQVQKAVSSYQTAIEKSQGNQRPVRALVELLLATGHLAEAQPFIKMLPAESRTSQETQAEISYLTGRDPEAGLARALEVISPDSQNAGDLVFLSHIQQAAKKLPDALATSQRATELDPQNSQAWLRYVTLLASTRQTEQADAALRKIQVTVDEKKMPLLMGQCSALLGRTEDAKQWYKQSYEAQPNDTIVVRNMIQLAMHMNDMTMANEYLDKLMQISAADRQSQADIAWARREKAKLLAASQTFSDFRKAIALIEENKNVNGELLGDDLSVWLLLHSNRPEPDSRAKAVAKLESLDRQYPLSASARVIQAKLYNLANRWTEAKSIMVSVLAEEPENEAAIAQYVDWLLQRDEVSDAAAWARKLSPNTSDGLRLSCIILVRQKQSKEAAKMLLALVPDDLPKERSGVIREVARMFAHLGQYDQNFYKLANTQWRRYLKLAPEAMPGYLEFLLSIPGEKQLDQALSVGDKLVQRAIRDEKWADVMQYVSITIAGLRNHKDDIKANPKYCQTVEQWLDAANKGANESAVVREQAALAELQDDPRKIEQRYRQFLALTSGSDIDKGIIRNNLAYLLAVNNKGQEALEVIQEAIRVLGVRTDLRDTRAMAYISMGRYQDALDDLQAVVESGEATAQLYFHLAMATHKNGQSKLAIEHMKKSLEMGLDLGSMSRAEQSLCQSLMTELGLSFPAT